jgi:hypothetical protein
VGEEGDVALYDGDPFADTGQCTGVVIEGEVVSEIVRQGRAGNLSNRGP